MSDEQITLTLSREDIRLVRAALMSFLEDFGHDEADMLRALKSILSKLPASE
ncbi:MAG: hypothetical protein ACXVRM_07730 [Solirubrobacteraceae bacterium]